MQFMAQRTITVTGYGKTQHLPDRATIQAGVQVIHAELPAAMDQANQAMNAVLVALQQHNIADVDVQTGTLTIMPEYTAQPTESPRRVGHRVTNEVHVTVKVIETIGTIVDALVVAGGDAIRLHNVGFSLSDPTTAKDEALRAAMIDARRQAEVLVAAAKAYEGDTTLGTILSLRVGQEQQLHSPRMAAYSRGVDTTPVAPGEITTEATVEVVYSLGANLPRFV